MEEIKETIKDWKTDFLINRIKHLERQGANLNNSEVLQALDNELERRDRQNNIMLAEILGDRKEWE